MIIWVMIVISVFSDMTVGIASGTVAALILVIVRFSKLEVRNICGRYGGEVPGDVLFPRRNAAFCWKTAVNFSIRWSTSVDCIVKEVHMCKNLSK